MEDIKKVLIMAVESMVKIIHHLEKILAQKESGSKEERVDTRTINLDKPTMTVTESAKIMHVTPQFLRAALMQNKFPFGVGIKMSQNEFYINTYRFKKYMKGEI